MTSRLVRRLTLALAALYAALGTLELVLKVRDDSEAATIAFFAGTLLGGATLILVGLFAQVSETKRRVLVILGAVTGMLASAWTLLLPALAVTVIVLNARGTPPDGEATPRT